MSFSKQRELIITYLKNTKEHPTAERIYAELKPVMPRLSLATVYRNLGLLCEQKQILRLKTGDGTDHFDADLKEHQHFVCSKCGGVKDLSFTLPRETILNSLGKHATVDTYRLYIYGTCDECNLENA